MRFARMCLRVCVDYYLIQYIVRRTRHEETPAASASPCAHARFGTCVLLVLLALYAGTGKRGLAAAAQIAAGVCALVSLGPLLLGIQNYSVTGALITASLLAECLWLCRVWRSKREDS